jgi:hypothetical protein
MVEVKFFIDKVREMFDLNKRIELAEKVLQEMFDVPSHSWGAEQDGKFKRAYAKYIYYFDDDEKHFVGEDEEGVKYYVNYIEFKVVELDPHKFYYKDWYIERVFDRHPEIAYELWKDVEVHGLIWRLYVRVGLQKDDQKDVEEDGFEKTLEKYRKMDPEFVEWLGKICQTNRLIV